MKKLLLSITALSLCLNAVSQNKAPRHQVPLAYPAPVKKWVAPVSGDEIPLTNVNQATAPAHSNYKYGNPSIAFTTLGTTTYDLQTNGSSANRIYSKSVGVAGTWTFSQALDLVAADRGSGYNFMTSPTGTWGPQPTTRVETDRRGWPEIDYSEAGGFECFVSHNGGIPGGCKLVKRSPAGNGPWAESPLPKATDDSTIIFIWPRMRIGGANGITIHEIDLSLPVANPPGVIYHGMDGALTYSRSQDGGLTWDIKHMFLPDEDSSLFNGMSGDSYSIDADGNEVAICYGEPAGDWCVWKSLDNGTTWARTVIRHFALPGYIGGTVTDTSGDAIADTLIGTDGTNAVLIDHNGLVHCWAGTMRMINDGSATTYNYFPGENGLLYWNESMGATPANFPVVGWCQDLNNNGVLDLQTATPGTYPGCNLATIPTVGIDAFGTIYLAYMSPVENTSNGVDQSYWQLFLKASPDGGVTWSPDTNIINDPFTEAVFPSIPRNIGSCIPILWQQDGEPGLAWRGDMDPVGSNDIDYLCVSHLPNIGVSVQNIPAPASIASVSPNPATDFVNLNYTLDKAKAVKINISNVLGQSVYQSEANMTSGPNSVTVNLKNFHAGLYFVNTTMGETTYSAKFIVE